MLIDDKVFMRRQQEHIERISNLSFKDCSIFKHMNNKLVTIPKSILDFLTDQTENVFPMVPNGKGLSEMILADGAEDL